MVAIGYVRRSKESTARTVSLEEQADRIRAYCAETGWKLAEVVTDDGISGGKRERIVRLEAQVRLHKAEAVIVYHLDRFARDVAALLDSLRVWARRGVALHVVGRGRVEVETASGFLMTGVEGLMAEHFRRLIGEKTKDALAGLKRKGRRVSGHLPMGYRLAEDGFHLEPEPDEQETLAQIAVLSGRGLSLRVVSAMLTKKGILARNGRPLAVSTLSRLVPNSRVGNTNPLVDTASKS